jgi:Phosphotransferase enzyme family
MLPQPGLKWVLNQYFEAEPTWTHDPKIETIIKLARQHFHFRDEDRCTADYYMQGAFNKIYLIRCPRDGKDEKSFVFRVSLPVDPGFKVASDVATLSFVGEHTSTPVPRVLASDTSHENELGFAWTIMQMMPGRPLCEQWRYMSQRQREDLVRKLAEILAHIFHHKFLGIGNIYQTSQMRMLNNKSGRNVQNDSRHFPKISKFPSQMTARATDLQLTQNERKNRTISTYRIGRIVSMSAFWHDRVHFNIDRGPFKCSFDWFATRLAFVITASEATMNNPATDQQHKYLASRHSSIAKRLQRQLPVFFPTNGVNGMTPELTTLHHHDVSGYNILVDREGKLTALLDWDSISAVPLWKACQMPDFLVSRLVDEMEVDHRLEHTNGNSGASLLSRGEAINLEKAKLRETFLTEMAKIAPRWVEIHRSSMRLADFDVAVDSCDSPFGLDLVDEWLRGIEEGKEYRSLQQLRHSGE